MVKYQKNTHTTHCVLFLRKLSDNWQLYSAILVEHSRNSKSNMKIVEKQKTKKNTIYFSKNFIIDYGFLSLNKIEELFVK